MQLWVPRWRDWGFLELSTIRETIRPSFAREIEKYLNESASDGGLGELRPE